jgi:hypothetical protein
MAARKSKSKTPGTVKEVLSENVRRQQRRANATASPPEARRPPRERIKTAEKKRKALTGGARAAGRSARR